jgi:hypothetical protein
VKVVGRGVYGKVAKDLLALGRSLLVFFVGYDWLFGLGELGKEVGFGVAETETFVDFEQH